MLPCTFISFREAKLHLKKCEIILSEQLGRDLVSLLLRIEGLIVLLAKEQLLSRLIVKPEQELFILGLTPSQLQVNFSLC